MRGRRQLSHARGFDPGHRSHVPPVLRSRPSLCYAPEQTPLPSWLQVAEMKALNGIHHISAITADATNNLRFYVGVMGLRLVKKTVNQDNPSVYHLFYADEQGSPGADLTFFEYPGLVRGRAGAGMIHRIGFRVASTQALDFWATRLAAAGIESVREDGRLSFEDPEGLRLELLSAPSSDAPLVARHDDIPEEFALQGFAGVRVSAHR